jgi:hypothetical protein
MSLFKQIPEGLKSHDVEQGNGTFRPPIPYVPERLDNLDPDRKVPHSPPPTNIEIGLEIQHL